MSQAPGFPVRSSSMQGYNGWSLPIPPLAGVSNLSSIRADGGNEEEGTPSLQWLEDASVLGQRRRVLPSADVGGRPPAFPCDEMPSVEIPEEMRSVLGQRRVLPSADVGGRPPTFPCNKMPSVEIPEEMHSADMDQGGGFTSLISHGIFPEASSGTAAPTEIVQANDVVPSSVRSNQKRSKNFSVDEDELLVSAWLNVSLDPVQGVDQSRSTYWKRIYEYFHSHKTFHSERTQSSLMNRWSGIQHDCNIFAGCVSRIEARNQSGLSIDDKQANALAMFQAEDKLHRKFPYIHCWKMLKSHAKWADRRKQIETQKTGTKKQKTTTTSSPATLVPLLPACGESELATCTLQRPAGKKKEREKLRRQSSIEALEYLMAKKKEADADKELKKEERFKKAFALEEERISLEKKQFELQRDMYEDTIIRLDFSSMTTEQQQHFLSRQEKIRARRPDY